MLLIGPVALPFLFFSDSTALPIYAIYFLVGFIPAMLIGFILFAFYDKVVNAFTLQAPSSDKVNGLGLLKLSTFSCETQTPILVII